MKQEKIFLWVSVSEAQKIHDIVIQEMGGRGGVHDQGLLESALSQPLMVVDYGSVEEQDVFYLAATYFFHIIKNHPFMDGNKRTGLLTALKFLAKNKFDIDEPSEALYEELYQLAIDTAASHKSKEEIAAFFKNLFTKLNHEQ